MQVRFWGVRGSLPTPERRNSRYGGNTTCVELRLANGTLIIFDCGTGLRGLGKSLLREFGPQPINGNIFLTHFHWDHIQGIPFFIPLYIEGNTLLFHSVLGNKDILRAVVEGQMVDPYFPVDASLMKSQRHHFILGEEPINLNGAIISTAPMNHPQGCTGYRVEADGKVFVFATDTEPGSPRHDRAIRQLAEGADLLVYDSQYTPQQLKHEKKGWGHSSWLEGVRVARDCGVKRFSLFHHDPDNDDAFIDRLVADARDQFENVSAASEGSQFILSAEGKIGLGLGAICDRRHDVRYNVKLPIDVAWRGAWGNIVGARALTRDVSRTGIYFVAPTQTSMDQPLRLKITLPGTNAHQGDMAYEFVARPVRRESQNAIFARDMGAVGVGARFIAPLTPEARLYGERELGPALEDECVAAGPLTDTGRCQTRKTKHLLDVSN